MSYDAEYIEKAEAALTSLLQEWRPKLMEHFGSSKFELKDDRTVVTELDKAMEVAIKDTLRVLDERVGFLGEEYGQEGSTDTFWLIDPIDGTEQFIRGLTGCRNLLCLISDGEPVYAMAYRFTTDDMFIARKGQGTKKNGKIITRQARPLNRIWVEMPVNMSKPENLKKMLAIDSVVATVMRSKEFLDVVDGGIDALIIPTEHGGEWDFAPRALLAQESGLRIANIGSDTYDYKNLSLIAAPADIFDQLHGLVSS